jgi:hypothetical protein
MKDMRIGQGQFSNVNESRPAWGLGSVRAQAMVEFILVLPMLLFLIFAVFDYGRLFLAQMNLKTPSRRRAGSPPRGIISPIPKTRGRIFRA